MLRMKPNPNPSPEHVKLVSEIGTKFVSPDCSKETSPAFWGGQAGHDDFESGGQMSNMPIDCECGHPQPWPLGLLGVQG